jgi:hypothetical protein
MASKLAYTKRKEKKKNEKSRGKGEEGVLFPSSFVKQIILDMVGSGASPRTKQKTK